MGKTAIIEGISMLFWINWAADRLWGGLFGGDALPHGERGGRDWMERGLGVVVLSAYGGWRENGVVWVVGKKDGSG